MATSRTGGDPTPGRGTRRGHAPTGVEYRVDVVPWTGGNDAAATLQRHLNQLAADGWEVVAILPTTASTSIRSLVNAHASADTTEFAVVLRRPPATESP